MQPEPQQNKHDEPSATLPNASFVAEPEESIELVSGSNSAEGSGNVLALADTASSDVNLHAIPSPESVVIRSRSLIGSRMSQEAAASEYLAPVAASPAFMKPTCVLGLGLGYTWLVISVLCFLGACWAVFRLNIGPSEVPYLGSSALGIIMLTCGVVGLIVSFYWSYCMHRLSALFEYSSPESRRRCRLGYGVMSLFISPGVVLIGGPAVASVLWLTRYMAPQPAIVFQLACLILPVILIATYFVTYRLMRRIFDYFQPDGTILQKKRVLSFLVASTPWLTPLLFVGFYFFILAPAMSGADALSVFTWRFVIVSILLYGVMQPIVHLIPFWILRATLYSRSAETARIGAAR
ncbi:MAG TPA: hypothetical protein V6C97_14615 [Oculatellaceae cyanobacterium]